MLIQTVPHAPGVITFDKALSTTTTIVFSWPALSGTETGGVTLDNYEVEYDQGTATWTSLVIQPGTSYTATGLTGGLTYQFQVRGINIYGSGPFSSVYSFVAGD